MVKNDLISRSALKDALEYWTHFPKHRGGKSVYDIIEDAPAVDAVVFTEAETFLLFSVANQIVREMEEQGRDTLYPRKFAAFQEIKRKLREHLEERRKNDG